MNATDTSSAIRTAMAALLLSAFGAGCTSTPLDGHWTGTTSYDRPVSFDISNSGTVLTNFQLETADACPLPSGRMCVYRASPMIHDPLTIANGEFVYSTSTYSFDGEFNSARTVTGHYVFNLYPVTCASSTCYHVWSGTWEATLAEGTP